MATTEQLYSALAKADAAGDVAGAKMLADHIRSLVAAPAPEAPKPDPSAGGGRLRVGPIDTGINTPEWLDRGLAGAGKGMADLARGVGQLTGKVSRDDVAESRKNDAPLMNTTAGQLGNVGGNVAAALPAAFMPGANTVAGSAVIGSLMGLLNPSTSTEETLKNVGYGGAAGAAVPAAITGYKAAKSFIEPFYEGGRNQILGRVLDKAAGGESATALTNLKNAQQLVPGSLPTAGEAAGVPSIAALERTASAIDPLAANQLAMRRMAQSEARNVALQGVAPDKAAAIAARSAATEPLYKQAYPAAITETPELAALMQRPSLAEALGRAKSLAKEQGQGLTINPGVPAQPSKILNTQGQPMSTSAAIPGSMTGRDAHLMKMGLDDMANAAPMTGIGGNELRAIQGTRGDFLSEVEKQVPAYGQARQAYADLSRPVNQADIVSEIAKKSTNFRGDMTPAAYAKALRDETVQSVTGQPTATLAKSMEPAQLGTLNNIKDDLLRADFAQTAGKGVGSDTVQKLAYGNMLDQAGIPNFLRNMGPAGVVGNVAQRIGQVAYKDANDKLSARLAQALLNPSDTAALFEAGMVTPQMQQLISGLRRSGTALGVAGVSSLNANQ